MVTILPADTGARIQLAGELFAEYARSLPFDLDFQDFDAELAEQLGADEYGMKSYILVILKTGPNETVKTNLIEQNHAVPGGEEFPAFVKLHLKSQGRQGLADIHTISIH